MRHPIIGQYSDAQIKFKRTTDTRNLVLQGPVFGWHQRAISQVIIILTTFFKEFRK